MVRKHLDDHPAIDQSDLFGRETSPKFIGGFNRSGFIQFDDDNLSGTSYAARIFHDDDEIPILSFERFLDFQRFAHIFKYLFVSEKSLCFRLSVSSVFMLSFPKRLTVSPWPYAETKE